MGGITVTATGSGGTFTTTTWDAGGYQMVLPAGSYTVTFSGAGLAGRAQYDVTMGTANLKLDGQTAAMVAARATTGDDVLTGGDMRDVFIGLAGRDALNGAGGDDMLIGDTLHASWFAEVAGQVFRLYQATLGRIPDNAGQQDWTGRIAVDGMALVDVAAGFMGSREFQNTYGALEIEPFLDLLYRNVLGRDADVAGRDFWIREMILNGATRADVVLGFSESREFRNATAAEATAFTAGNGPAGWSDDVFRLYQATLDRAPDLAGFLGWTGQLGSGTPFLTAIEGFTGSREFTNTYGAVSDAGFVELLYQNVLGRAADAAGLADWIARLGGGDSRAQVVEGFAQSREFIRGTAADVTDWIRAQGTDDVLNAGAGTDVLAGGILADSFVFDPAETPGQKRVLDLEPWDSIDLSAFGYGSDAAARSHFSQQGADVVFEDQNVTVIFANTEMALISDEMILV
jgi:Ca2+-binding RTX toxin-like protein